MLLAQILVLLVQNSFCKTPENIKFIQLDYKDNCYFVVKDGGNENA